jgi:SEC-C motif-containing protein
MRSRYSAFVVGNIDYIMDTHVASGRHELDRDSTTSWSKNSEWQGLDVLEVHAGGESDDEGTVEFIARYRLQEEDQVHHELAVFRKTEGRWFFVDGKPPALEPIRREAPKIGRNDPCHCGSGKKYKKCHFGLDQSRTT